MINYVVLDPCDEHFSSRNKTESEGSYIHIIYKTAHNYTQTGFYFSLIRTKGAFRHYNTLCRTLRCNACNQRLIIIVAIHKDETQIIILVLPKTLVYVPFVSHGNICYLHALKFRFEYSL